jgi:hypothetical protein
VVVEMINIRMRRRGKPVDLHDRDLPRKDSRPH